MTENTIFALSSGAPPAALGVIRVSGPHAAAAMTALAGRVVAPRRASLRTLHDGDGVVLDEALVLWFPGPRSTTGEDLLELHCHGGRAVIAAVLARLGALDGLREAAPGEFTRRAFANGRIDLAEAEGLADLLAAETEWQRRGAIQAAGGALSRRIGAWRETILGLSAQIEAVIDFGDEDDVGDLPSGFLAAVEALAGEIAETLARPATDRLRDGVRVVFAGPPNAGKSSLFNALLDTEAAIVSPEAGTTRDVIERPVALGGIPLVLVDTAGLREQAAGAIEAIGIDRAQAQLDLADIVLWLGPESERREGALQVHAKADLAGDHGGGGLAVSAHSGAGLDDLRAAILERAKAALPAPDMPSLSRRQKGIAAVTLEALGRVAQARDHLTMAEDLRVARVALDTLTGRNSTEDMLDALFGRFCIGK